MCSDIRKMSEMFFQLLTASLYSRVKLSCYLKLAWKIYVENSCLMHLEMMMSNWTKTIKLQPENQNNHLEDDKKSSEELREIIELAENLNTGTFSHTHSKSLIIIIKKSIIATSTQPLKWSLFEQWPHKTWIYINSLEYSLHLSSLLGTFGSHMCRCCTHKRGWCPCFLEQLWITHATQHCRLQAAHAVETAGKSRI